MKRQWEEQEVAEHWSLSHDELELVRDRTDRSRLGFAALLKVFQAEGRFPSERREVPRLALDYLVNQLEVSGEAFNEYELSGRSCERDRAQIRSLLGFRPVTIEDADELAEWLRLEALPRDHKPEHLREAALEWCRKARIEPPTPPHLDRIIGSAVNAFESKFIAASLERIPSACRAALDDLLKASGDGDTTSEVERTPLAELRADPGRPSLESVLKEITKLQRIDASTRSM